MFVEAGVTCDPTDVTNNINTSDCQIHKANIIININKIYANRSILYANRYLCS